MKKKNRLQMLAALLAATLSMALTSPIAAKANEEYNVDTTKETNATAGRIYYLKNSHGDVIGQMDENGNVLTSYAYNAFGEQVSAVATKGEQKSTANRFLYAGEQYDETSGFYYLRARHYDGKNGRFTQEDTYLGDGRNLYAYVHSNPLKYVDPTGHYDQENFDPDGNSWDEKIKNEGGGGGQSAPSSVSNQKPDLYHYTDTKGARAIQESGIIKPDSQGRVFVTTDEISPQDANNALFMGAKGNDCATYRVEINLTNPNDVNLTTNGVTQPNELIYLGSLRNGKNVNFIVMENNF